MIACYSSRQLVPPRALYQEWAAHLMETGEVEAAEASSQASPVTALCMENQQLSKINTLQNCSMLRYICLRNNWLSSATGLEQCPDVLEACLAGNFITSAVPLRHLFHLQRLEREIELGGGGGWRAYCTDACLGLCVCLCSTQA